MKRLGWFGRKAQLTSDERADPARQAETAQRQAAAEGAHHPPPDVQPYQPGVPEDARTDVTQPYVQEEMAEEGEAKVYVASQWKLMWWRYRRSPLAMIGLVLVIILYLIAIFVEFLAPYTPGTYNAQYTYAPPQRLHLFDRTEDGSLTFSPYVNGYESEVDPESLRRTFVVAEDAKIPVSFFGRGVEYELLGFIPMSRHLITPAEPGAPMYLLGADRNGRDVFTRIIYGTRISLSIGLVGIAFSLVLGILIGGVSGYYSGVIDLAVQRVIEFIGALPTLPLWLGLAAALPPRWPPLWVYFGITIILSLIGWTGLARTVRGKFLALREEDFVTAARLDGSSELRIILRHMLPSFTSHIIAGLTLAIPGMILAETALSFLGLGLRPPIVSWGVLLNEAQTVRVIATAPWLLAPGIAVIVAVMGLYFVGDGLRDAADPYAA